MLERIKQVNESLPGMILVEGLYFVIGAIIILIAVPDNKGYCVSGLSFGVFYAVFSSIHMSFVIRKVVYSNEQGSKSYILGYLIRLLVMIAVFLLLFLLHAGNPVCAIIGMFSMKVAAYIEPFTHKLLS